MPASADLLVLGGGPAGALAATVAARAGLHVTLLEREAGARHKVCGEFLSAEALQLLAGVGIFPADQGALAIHTVRLASGQHVAQATLPFPARSLTRHDLDELLLAAAADAGATVLRGAHVQSLNETRGRWQVTLGDGSVMSASRVILATGKHDLRGFRRPAGWQGDLVALKMYLRLSPAQADALYGAVELLLHPHGYTGLQLVDSTTANLTALLRRKHLAALGGWDGFLQELTKGNQHASLRLLGAEPLLSKPLAISNIPYGFVRGRALAPMLYAVGDQAAVIPSFTGDGMSIALFSGLRAAQAILQGEAASSFQPALARQLRLQVGMATALSRLLVLPALQGPLTRAAGMWPAALSHAASLTRLRSSVLPLAAHTLAPSLG